MGTGSGRERVQASFHTREFMGELHSSHIISYKDSLLYKLCVFIEKYKEQNNIQSKTIFHPSSIFTLSVHASILEPASVGCRLRIVQTGRQLITELGAAQNGGLDGEEVLVFHLGTADPHELCQTHKVLDVMARAAPTGGDLVGDVRIRSRAQVHGVVRSGNIDQGQKRLLVLLFWEKLNLLYDVSSQQNLSGVQVLERAFNVRVRYLIRHSPCAGLQQMEGRYDDAAVAKFHFI